MPLRLAPRVFRRDSKIFLAVLIYLSHIPPMLLAAVGFLFLDIHSPPLSYMNWLIFWYFVSMKALVSSAEAPTKLVPLSGLVSLTFPFSPINLHRHIINQSILSSISMDGSSGQTSKQFSVSLQFFAPFFHNLWTKKVNTTVGKRRLLAHPC